MKRIVLIFLTTLIYFNIGAIIIILKKYGIEHEVELILKVHYEVSIYALKCGAIGVIVDWISRYWFDKRDE